MNTLFLVQKLSARVGLMALAAGLLIAVPAARAQMAVSMTDSNFLQAVAQSGMVEVTLGKDASKKGTKDTVQLFGEQMVKDHGAMGVDLKALAAKKNVTLATEIDAKHQTVVDKVSGLPGSEFDDTYIIEMVKAHQKDQKAFKDELTVTQDPDIEAFVIKYQPMIDMHLKHVAGMQTAAISAAGPQTP